MKIKYFISIFSIMAASAQSWCAEPQGYYNSCEGKSGAALLTQLRSVVGPHTDVGYDGLWEVYVDSDTDSDGLMWDMYSTKRWSFGEKCGNYSSVGDCVNREHSFPKSWFSERSPMKSDAFHIYPTDGKVNGQRSNFPYGECSGGTTLPSSGSVKALGRLGVSTYPGYTGKVFEPDDEYKGDFARSYFYMAAAYNDKIASWSSPQLAGNAYPAFSDWSVSLLMKWHRQDPVSQKEIDRNDAVYKHQKNRNPFIDHPDMAEHIWGDLSTIGWSADGEHPAQITSPANGSTIDLGPVAADIARTLPVTVRGSWITEDASVTVAGSGFSVTPATLPAASLNQGATVYVTVDYDEPGSLTGTLTVRSGDAVSTATLIANITTGIPVTAPTHISDHEFTFGWVNIAGSGSYTLTVARDGSAIAGYPRDVNAADEQYTVSGLDPQTTYTYQLTRGTLHSQLIEVTTAEPMPYIQAIYDGELTFSAIEGNASTPAEIRITTENIADDVTVSVAAPFELSTDTHAWTPSLTLSGDDDTFFVRLGIATQGEYSTSLIMKAGSYTNDDVELTGTVVADEALYEDFEIEPKKDNYTNGSWTGNAGEWYCDNVGVYKADDSKAYEGEGCARFGNNATSTLTLQRECHGGIGLVSFYAKTWGSDADSSLAVEVSTDHGTTWRQINTVSIPKGVDYTYYASTANTNGPVRLRLRQISGKRILMDNIRATSYTSSGVENVADAATTWTAYSYCGLTINAAVPATITVYSYDGRTVWHGCVAGETTISLPSGIYLATDGTTARKVMVKD